MTGFPKVLILGATGMPGHALFSLLVGRPEFTVFATVRGTEDLDRWYPPEYLAGAVSSAVAKILPDCKWR